MEQSNNEIVISNRIDEQLHQKLKIAVARNRTTIKDVLEKLISNYLKKEAKDGGIETS